MLFWSSDRSKGMSNSEMTSFAKNVQIVSFFRLSEKRVLFRHKPQVIGVFKLCYEMFKKWTRVLFLNTNPSDFLPRKCSAHSCVSISQIFQRDLFFSQKNGFFRSGPFSTNGDIGMPYAFEPSEPPHLGDPLDSLNSHVRIWRVRERRSRAHLSIMEKVILFSAHFWSRKSSTFWHTFGVSFLHLFCHTKVDQKLIKKSVVERSEIIFLMTKSWSGII